MTHDFNTFLRQKIRNKEFRESYENQALKTSDSVVYIVTNLPAFISYARIVVTRNQLIDGPPKIYTLQVKLNRSIRGRGEPCNSLHAAKILYAKHYQKKAAWELRETFKETI